MAREQETCTDFVILMKPDPVSGLRSHYRTLRRQVFFIQLVCVLFSVVSCLLTVIHYTYPAKCTENLTERTPPIIGMLHQVSEERNEPFSLTRLTVKNSINSKDGYVPWMPASNQPTNNIQHFTLAEDGKSLIVNRTGMYKVSLQITYRGIGEINNSQLTLQHDIKRKTDAYGKELLLLTHTETVHSTSPDWRKSLFSGDFFFLQEGDKLKVLSNYLKLIDCYVDSEQKNFFVLYPQFST